jgi:hypothetical protein
LNRHEHPPGHEEKEAGRFYQCLVHPVEIGSEPLTIAVCEFSAGQQVKDTRVLEIEATYFVGFRVDESQVSDVERRQILEQMAGAAAWPLFRDLFIHIGSQSGEELPLLPNVPKVRWLSAIKSDPISDASAGDPSTPE